MFRILYFPNFEKELKKIFSKRELIYFENYIDKNIIFYGNKIGKVLTYNYLREIKIGIKRVYYLVYNDINTILFVAVSKNKKDQQQIIDFIRENIDVYRSFIQNFY